MPAPPTNAPPVAVDAVTEDGGRFRIALTAPSLAGQAVTVAIGGVVVLSAPVAPDGTASGAIRAEDLKDLGGGEVSVRDASGTALAGATLRGDLFEAVSLPPERFHEKVQLHHSRYASPHLLEIAARTSFLSSPPDAFVLRAAALTILAHRYLERRPDTLTEGEFARVAWIVGHAAELVPQGEALIAAGEAPGKRLDWRHVRWTVSLATVAAHLSLLDESYGAALDFLSAATRHTRLVHVAKVSALNLTICSFAEGIVAHMLGRHDQARAALLNGVESVKPIVAAQNLTENVWVLGDLQNVIKGARQCYIALVRLGLLEVRASPPVLEEGTRIITADVRGPLEKILRSGRARDLDRHLSKHGWV